MFKNENEWQKTEQVPIPFPTGSRKFPDAKTRNGKKFDNWTFEIIPFIRLSKQMDRTKRSNFFPLTLPGLDVSMYTFRKKGKKLGPYVIH